MHAGIYLANIQFTQLLFYLIEIINRQILNIFNKLNSDVGWWTDSLICSGAGEERMMIWPTGSGKYTLSIQIEFILNIDYKQRVSLLVLLCLFLPLSPLSFTTLFFSLCQRLEEWWYFSHTNFRRINIRSNLVCLLVEKTACVMFDNVVI